MEGEEPIEKYVQRYKKLNDSLSSEEKDVIKFFSSLSREAIDVCYDWFNYAMFGLMGITDNHANN